MSVMKGLILSTREQTRLTIMNMILDRRYPVKEAAQLIGISERHTWRLLAAYRREGAAALAHKNRGRLPWNSKDTDMLTRVVELARNPTELIRLKNHLVNEHTHGVLFDTPKFVINFENKLFNLV